MYIYIGLNNTVVDIYVYIYGKHTGCYGQNRKEMYQVRYQYISA